jgi:hypothetical protein
MARARTSPEKKRGARGDAPARARATRTDAERSAQRDRGAKKGRGAEEPLASTAQPAARRRASRRPSTPPPPPRKRRRAAPKESPLARSTGAPDETLTPPPAPEAENPLVMELSWGDDPAIAPPELGLVQRWAKRGDALLRHLAEHGAARHEYRADLKAGRFVWIDPDGRVSAEAESRLICTWVRSTSALVMGWVDPLGRRASVARIEGVAAERDDVDEEGVWRVAMEAADASRAEYLYRVTTPDAWYFLALNALSFTPERASFAPGTPVGLVLRSLSEARRGVESRAEPADVVRERIDGVGRSLLHEAGYAYRGTDWVARLERAGRRLIHLADRLPRSSFGSVAAGRPADEWLSRDTTIELGQAIALLEDEWALFA